MIGKGKRSQAVIDGIVRNGAVYFAAVGGAMFLVLADTVARTVASPAELPIRAVTAMIGAPYFIFLLNKHKKG